jgi:hypothetical protein
MYRSTFKKPKPKSKSKFTKKNQTGIKRTSRLSKTPKTSRLSKTPKRFKMKNGYYHFTCDCRLHNISKTGLIPGAISTLGSSNNKSIYFFKVKNNRFENIDTVIRVFCFIFYECQKQQCGKPVLFKIKQNNDIHISKNPYMPYEYYTNDIVRPLYLEYIHPEKWPKQLYDIYKHTNGPDAPTCKNAWSVKI